MKTVAILVTICAAALVGQGCDQPPIEPDPMADPLACPSTATAAPLVGTWQRADGYTLVFGADGTFTPGSATTFAWTGHGTWTATATVLVVQDDGHDVYPSTYSSFGDVLTLGPDGPLQEGTYVRAPCGVRRDR